MSSLHALTFTDLLNRIAAPEPTPGGGSVAALAGAFGIALAQMVAGLPRTRHNNDEERGTLAALQPSLATLRDQLTGLADDDTAAFDGLMAAFRLPKASDDEKAARKAAIQQATRQATTVPLQTAMACARGLELLTTVAAHGNTSATSDVRVAVGMLQTAANGAAANVRINLESISDDGFRADTTAQLTAVLDQVESHVHAASAALQG